MQHRFILLVALCAALFWGAACDAGTPTLETPDAARAGRILLWHTWSGEATNTLNTMLSLYQEINPDVEVISIGVEAADVVNRFEESSKGGLGPDLLLVDASVVHELAQRNLLRDLTPIDLSTFLASAARMVATDVETFAIPFSAHTEVLYYNRELVQTPPATIAELMQRVAAGEAFAQSAQFVDSYWGVGAYDGGIVDSRGRLLFGLGGFTNWLDFLATARVLPGFRLDTDREALQQAFIDGQVAYFVADSAIIPDLLAAMGPEKVGVALLPSGPNGGVARPFLRTDAFAFSRVTSDSEFTLALDLAEFLSGAQNQLFMATRRLGRVPVNSQVRLTPSLPADTLTVARQTRAAEPVLFANQSLWKDLNAGALGFFDSYRQVSQGILTPAQMVAQGLAAFSSQYAMQPRVTDPADLCPVQPGAITIWHTLSIGEAQVFTALARQFQEICPGSAIEVVQKNGDEIAGLFAEEARSGGGPDLLFESSRWLAPLADEGLLLDLTERVSPRFLQQFVPNTVEVMRYRDRLYGVPESIVVLALFYNRAAVSEPPIDVQQLAQSVSATRRAVLPVGFFWAYWGMDPFGGFAFDSYTGKVLETAGLVAWLQALQRVEPVPGMELTFDFGAAEDAFAFEEAAYLVSGPWSLPRLRQSIGERNFGVAPLPNGPVGPGSPILQVRGSMINANASSLEIDLALAFSYFINLPENQERFLTTESHVTASVTIDLTGHPNLDSFREQAKSAANVVENSNHVILETFGDQLYHDVLIEGADPTIAVPLFVEAVEAATAGQ